MTGDSLSTKDRLLDAAEQLFACKGFEDVSIRELATLADVNVAAVNYHFNNKENLFHEVCARRFTAQRDRTLNALEALLKEAVPRPGVDDVVATLVRQFLEGTLATDGGPGFLMAVARELHERRSGDHVGMFKDLIQPVFCAFAAALQAAAPAMDPQEITWIIESVVGQIHHFIMSWIKKESLDAAGETHAIMVGMFPVLGQPLPTYIDQVTEHLTRYTTAAINELNRKETA